MERPTRRSVGRSLGVLLAMIAAIVAVVGPTNPAGAATPRFIVDLNMSDSNQPGVAIRDGGGPLPPSGSHGPFFELYGWVSDVVWLQSFGGFQGTINLSVSNLPAGVTLEQMPASVTLAAGRSASFPLRVRVAQSVPLGTVFSGIKITGRSGALTVVETMVAPITVVDPLPCSTYDPTVC